MKDRNAAPQSSPNTFDFGGSFEAWESRVR